MDMHVSQERSHLIAQIQNVDVWDMLVIGGGITGAGIAREASRQGLKVLLLEQKDFAWGTSSRSSKMVHGGLRYLASGNLKLTSHSVKERERLLKEAPGLVELMPYSWPHYKGQVPSPLLFNGLLSVYDQFAGKRYRQYFAKSEALYQLPRINGDGLLGVTRFADAVTDDTRLTMRVLHEAKRDGAVLLNYCQVKTLQSNGRVIERVEAQDVHGGTSLQVKAKVVVSATGAWADQLRSQLGGAAKIRPLRGSHLIIPSWRLPMAQAVTLKHPNDNRSMFIYPWEGMTVIGTTDLDHPQVDLFEPNIQHHEVDYLLAAVNALFPGSHITSQDIVSTFAGVRPIVASGSKLNPSSEKRDHSIWNEKGLISVSGGKLTTFRLIALDVLKEARVYLSSIEGRDFGQSVFCYHSKELDLPLEGKWLKRMQGFYGDQLMLMVNNPDEDKWQFIPGTQTFWAQLQFSAQYEQVINLDDLLLRRTRIGLCLPKGGVLLQEQIKEKCQHLLGWSDQQWQMQWQRYQEIWRKHYSLPNPSEE